MEHGSLSSDMLIDSFSRPIAMPSSYAQQLSSDVKDGKISVSQVGLALAKFINYFATTEDMDEEAIDQRGVWLTLIGDDIASKIMQVSEKNRHEDLPFSLHVWLYLTGCWEQSQVLRDNRDNIQAELQKVNADIIREHKLRMERRNSIKPLVATTIRQSFQTSEHAGTVSVKSQKQRGSLAYVGRSRFPEDEALPKRNTGFEPLGQKNSTAKKGGSRTRKTNKKSGLHERTSKAGT